MSDARRHRKDWRVKPGIDKQCCSVDQAHGTQKSECSIEIQSCGLAMFFGKLQARDSKLFDTLGDAVLQSPSHVALRPLGEQVNYVHAFTKELGVQDNLSRRLHRRFLDATLISTTYVLWLAKVPFVVYEFHSARLRPSPQRGRDLGSD